MSSAMLIGTAVRCSPSTGRLKTREWKTRHQTAGVKNAGVTSIESQNSRYLTLLQVGYNVN